MTVHTRREGNTGFVQMDNPPVNAINQKIRMGLLHAVKWAESEMLDRVILSGLGRAFAAGADVKEFDADPLEPHLPDVLNAIDQSFVPWVAVMDGVALGGGLEIALACRMRIAAPQSRLGLPEVTLGVIPGAGGTQRLPRLVGLNAALKMISTGKPLTADEALSAGLVHAVETDAEDAAFMVNTEELQCIVPTWELPAPEIDQDEMDAFLFQRQKRQPGQIAPMRAIEVIKEGLSVPFHEALLIERNAFLELRDSDQARALRHVFFAERAAKAPAWLTAEPLELHHIAIIGGGTMGAAISYALINAGYRVTLVESDSDGEKRASDNLEKIIEASLKRGLIDEQGAAQRRDRIVFTQDYARAADASLVIEAAFESLEVKREIFAKLEKVVSERAVLATNTSYLDIDEIAQAVANPSRVVGLHFFAPAHVMKLLEIVRGRETSDIALATGFALAKKLRKIPVLAGVCDGFIGNRILARYREAADTVFMDGSTPWEVDEAMVAFGYAMGPYEAQDLSGLDIAYANRRRQDATRDPNRRYVPIADRMIELGKLGRKTGAGWYRYPGGAGKVEDPIVADLALEEAHLAKIERTDYEPAEISRRLLLAMINEAADILHEGIAGSARDIDLVTVCGYGFPRWRGGLMHYADAVGAQNIIRDLEKLGEEDPVAWKISPVLQECSDKNITLADWRNTES